MKIWHYYFSSLHAWYVKTNLPEKHSNISLVLKITWTASDINQKFKESSNLYLFRTHTNIMTLGAQTQNNFIYTKFHSLFLTSHTKRSITLLSKSGFNCTDSFSIAKTCIKAFFGL